MEKIDVLKFATRLLHPRHVVIATCVDKAGKPNAISLAWSMPVSHNPPIVVISVSPRRYSHRLIAESREFVLNVPTIELVKQTLFIGRRSGREFDKFKETGLTPLPAKKVNPPIIKECIAHLECKAREQIDAGDHTLFIADVVAAYVNQDVFKEKMNIRKAKPIYHIGEDSFTSLTDEVITPKL